MTPKQVAEAVNVPKHKKVVMYLKEKTHVLGKIYLGASYSAMGYINESRRHIT